jgi:hypothetical protein
MEGWRHLLELLKFLIEAFFTKKAGSDPDSINIYLNNQCFGSGLHLNSIRLAVPHPDPDSIRLEEPDLDPGG